MKEQKLMRGDRSRLWEKANRTREAYKALKEIDPAEYERRAGLGSYVPIMVEEGLKGRALGFSAQIEALFASHALRAVKAEANACLATAQKPLGALKDVLSVTAAAPVMYELLVDILDELRRATRDAIETGNREGSSLPVKLERRIYEALEKVGGADV